MTRMYCLDHLWFTICYLQMLNTWSLKSWVAHTTCTTCELMGFISSDQFLCKVYTKLLMKKRFEGFEGCGALLLWSSLSMLCNCEKPIKTLEHGGHQQSNAHMLHSSQHDCGRCGQCQRTSRHFLGLIENNMPTFRGLTFNELMAKTIDIHYTLTGDLIQHLWEQEGLSNQIL